MKKILINLSKVIMVFSILFSQFTPVMSVFAETITSTLTSEVSLGNDENQLILKVDDSSLIDDDLYSLDCNISFYYADGTYGEGFNFTRQNSQDKELKGSDLKSGYIVIDDLSGAMNTNHNGVIFSNYENGYCIDGICYNGKFVFSANIKDSNNNSVGIITEDIITINKDTGKIVYGGYQLDSNAKQSLENNTINVNDNVSNLKIFAYLEDLNLNNNSTYSVIGNGYALNTMISPKEIMSEKSFDYSFIDKIAGKYTILNNYTLNGQTYESSIIVNYQNLDDYLNDDIRFSFDSVNSKLVIKPVYDDNTIKYQDIYNYLAINKYNNNYIVELYDGNGSLLSSDLYNNNVTSGSKVVVTYNGSDKDTVSYRYEFIITNQYDYDNNGKVTNEDLNSAINDKLTNPNGGLTNDDLRDIQSGIDDFSDNTITSDSLTLTGDSKEVVNGEEVEVSFVLSGLTGSAFINNIAGMLNYDTNYLSLKEVKLDSENVGNIVNDNFYYATNKLYNGNVITLVFDTLQSSDDYIDIAINNLELGQYNGLFTNPSIVNGRVKINKSSDATLSNLSANNLVGFNSNSFEYDITIDSDIDKLDLSYITNNKNATVIFDENTNGNYEVGVTKTLVIKVIAEDGVTTKEYKINVTKTLSNNSSLDNIVIDNNDINYNKDIKEYNISVDKDTNSLNLIPYLSDSKAHYYISGNENFKSGLNKVIITVVAEDGTTSTYIINVYKESENNSTYSSNTGSVNNGDDTEEVLSDDVETDLESAETKSKKNKKSKTDKDEDDEVDTSQVIIIILIILVIGGLIYLIFKDNDDDDDIIQKPVDNKSSNNSNKSNKNNNKKKK